MRLQVLWVALTLRVSSNFFFLVRMEFFGRMKFENFFFFLIKSISLFLSILFSRTEIIFFQCINTKLINVNQHKMLINDIYLIFYLMSIEKLAFSSYEAKLFEIFVTFSYVGVCFFNTIYNSIWAPKKKIYLINIDYKK